MSISEGMGQKWGSYLGGGLGALQQVVEKIKGFIGGLLQRPEKFYYEIRIEGTAYKIISVIYPIIGTSINQLIFKILLKGNLIKPIIKNFNIIGKKNLSLILDFMMDEE